MTSSVITGQQAKAPRRKTLTVAMLDDWIAQAQPGARLVYFHGVFAGLLPEALNARLQAEEARGMIYLVQDFRRRDIDGHDYLAIRSSRPAGQVSTARSTAPLSMAAQARAEGVRAFRSSGR